jgi:hypothetical protein
MALVSVLCAGMEGCRWIEQAEAVVPGSTTATSHVVRMKEPCDGPDH